MKDWKPTANVKVLRLRAQLYALIRKFFAERGVLEVETPILSMAGNTDPNIDSFQLQFIGPRSAGTGQRWLRTSPEFPLKRMLAAGVGDCYEMGRVFRNGEAGRRHNPEFTMLEWYRVGWNHHKLMDECAELVKEALHLAGRRATVRDVSFHQLYQDSFGFDPLTCSEAELRAPLAVYDIDPEGLTRDDWLDLLMTHLIQPSIPANRVMLVFDYPASQCALAKIRPGDVPVAERFEIFVGPLELANGYHELTDGTEQRERFGRDLATRAKRAAIQPPVDERLLAALPKLPGCAGVALGVDRLMMAMLGSERIADVLAFPFDRA
ncbi:MAG TPA: EF-P lysine aminoacylase EpmA [Arenimonas sp.]|uniref:EF-P lysine aminoacylase EpmA n=1 Tax=Arenimonas sp. TaxID=1872635 RepID=UPI002C554E57|nr:EF-P lysine aminoacylase EpmA [Arenimonas sp.]HMB56216.1 EF-P lysine aminoacylase EpmA [Arenimonas sp.]